MVFIWARFVKGHKVRLKITRALSGSIDGIQLSHFVVGHVYELTTPVGSFLLSVGAAEPDREPEPDTSDEPVLIASTQPGDRA